MIRVGTASWADPMLIASGLFYPPAVRTPEARLRWYATRFDLVEVDSSYYAIPAPASAAAWAARTPSGFAIDIKAFRAFTGHAIPPAALHRDLQQALGPLPAARGLYERDLPAVVREALWQRFDAALQPLDAAGRLKLVHFQFAPWITANREGHARVRHCVERMAGRTVSVEFRHRSWFEGAQQARTLAFERELGVVHTVVDAPQGADNTVPAVWEATHPDWALLRLHGRNAATWNLPGALRAADRFNYDYPDHELAELVPAIRRLAAQVQELHVVFNNNRDDQAPRNARTLQGLLAAVPA